MLKPAKHRFLFSHRRLDSRVAGQIQHPQRKGVGAFFVEENSQSVGLNDLARFGWEVLDSSCGSRCALRRRDTPISELQCCLSDGGG